jgi:FAD/FMN-containing dehydrogenase
VSAILDRVGRWARTFAINTLNTAVYILSLGNVTLHEGRFSWLTRRWSNWNRTFAGRPARYVRPTAEDEICKAVGSAERVRVVGGGHTFNASPLTEHTLISLDRYNKVLAVDRDRKVVRAQAGIRLRDLMPRLEAHGLDLPLLGSTNAQSLAGLVATDLHGTGRDHGFLSEQVLSLRVVNAHGEAQTFRRGEPVFHAVLGGLGCCGVVTEIELQCVEAYNLAKSIQIVRRDWAEENIERLLEEHRHLSFYYLGGVDAENIRMNIWDRTPRPPNASYPWRDMYLELVDMFFTGYVIGMARTMKAADLTARLGLAFFKLTMDGHKTIYPSSIGFRRKLYYRHDELEYGVPFERYRECLAEIRAMLRRKKFVTIIEVRFAPDRSQGLLGPGVGRRTCFIELAPGLSRDPAEIYREGEAILRRYGGQLHLGKATGATLEDLREMFGERLAQFEKVRREQDAAGKFENPFTRTLFGPATAPAEATAVRPPEGV